MNNQPQQIIRVLHIVDCSPRNLNTRELMLSEVAYTNVNVEMDTALIVKNQWGATGTVSLSRLREWMTHSLSA